MSTTINSLAFATMTNSFFDLPYLEETPSWALTSEELRAYLSPDQQQPDGPQSIEELLPYLAHAAELTEFSAQSRKLGLDNVLVGRGRAGLSERSGDAGFCYSIDEYPELPSSLLMIDPEQKHAHLSLVDLFLHEATHLFMFDESHNWRFLVMLNVMRVRCELSCTEDAYDWRDVQYLPETAGQFNADRAIREIGSEMARHLSELPCQTRELSFIINALWDEIDLEIADAETAADFENLCRNKTQQTVAKHQLAV